MRLGRHVALTLLVWGATTATALATDDLGAVLQIFGAFAASVIGYVLPALLWLRAHDSELQQALATAKGVSGDGGGGGDGGDGSGGGVFPAAGAFGGAILPW
jgi:uncharacterized membrane protein YgcG